MKNTLTSELQALLNDSHNTKVLVTVDDDGAAYPAVKSSLHIGEHEDGNIVYFEFLESSKTNRYLTKALWFNKKVRIVVFTKDEKTFVITALPVRAIANGKIFQTYYERVQKQFGDTDLSTVWVLQPVSVSEQRLRERIAEESANRPYFQHLDRLEKREEAV
jgi:hypothetical protein